MGKSYVMFRFCIIISFFVFLFTSCNCSEGRNIKVLSLNIRLDTQVDGSNAWPHRASIVSGFIDDKRPDLFGLQEVLWHQYEYLDSTLQGYNSVIAGRDDGLRAGEACPVFFRDDRFDKLAGGTFWLSETPDVPGSIGWGAALTRVATWVRLYDKKTNDTLLFFNTHFDHISDSARYMSSGVLLDNVRRLAGDNDFIITGDFNAKPGSPAIKRMLDDGLVIDSYAASETRLEGVKYTFNGWENRITGERIDYIFIRKGMRSKSEYIWKVIEKGVFISDHWPVTAIISKGR